MASLAWTEAMQQMALDWQQLAADDFNSAASAAGLAWRMSPPTATATVMTKPAMLSLLKHIVRGSGVAASAFALPIARGRLARRAVARAVKSTPKLMPYSAIGALPLPQVLAIAALGASGDRIATLLWRLTHQEVKRQLVAKSEVRRLTRRQ